MKSDCSSPHTLSAPAPRTRILNTNRTVSQIFPTTVECAWTLSSSLPRKSQSPIFKLIEFLKEKTLSLIGQSSSAAIYMQWCSFVFTYFKQALFMDSENTVFVVKSGDKPGAFPWRTWEPRFLCWKPKTLIVIVAILYPVFNSAGACLYSA